MVAPICSLGSLSVVMPARSTVCAGMEFRPVVDEECLSIAVWAVGGGPLHMNGRHSSFVEAQRQFEPHGCH